MINQENHIIRKADHSDLDEIKVLTDAHKQELGFVLRPVLARSIDQGELIVAVNGAGLVGFVQYHHRRDTQTTLHNVVVKPDHRNQGVGKQLIQALEAEARANDKKFILLKCPEELSANNFYDRIGYEKINTEDGKSRRLNIWKKEM